MLRDRLRDIPVGSVFEEVYARRPRERFRKITQSEYERISTGERFPVLRGTCRCIVIAPTAEGGWE